MLIHYAVSCQPAQRQIYRAPLLFLCFVTSILSQKFLEFDKIRAVFFPIASDIKVKYLMMQSCSIGKVGKLAIDSIMSLWQWRIFSVFCLLWSASLQKHHLEAPNIIHMASFQITFNPQFNEYIIEAKLNSISMHYEPHLLAHLTVIN